jgi:hypothetical protein
LIAYLLIFIGASLSKQGEDIPEDAVLPAVEASNDKTKPMKPGKRQARKKPVREV